MTMGDETTRGDLESVLKSLEFERPISRRSLLRLAGAAGLGGASWSLLAACGLSSTTTSSGPTESGPFKLAVIGPLTGLLASSWGIFNAPLFVAMDEINAKGGILKRKIEIVKYDDQSQPATEPVVAQRIAADGIKFVSGPVGTSAALPSLEQTQRAGIIQGHWGADPRISDPKRYPGSYLVNMTSDQSARITLTYLLDKVGVKKVAIALANTGDGRAYTDTATYVLSQRGISPAAVEVFEQGSTGLAALVQKLKGTGADCFLVYGAATGDYTNIFKAMLDVNWLPVVGTNSSTLFGIKLLIKDLPNSFLDKIHSTAYKNLTWTSSRPVSDRVANVLQKVASQPNFPPSAVNPSFQGPFYDWLYLLKTAIESANSFDPGKVRDALNSIHNYDGLLGKISFSGSNHLAFADDQLTVGRPTDLTDPKAHGFLPVSVLG
jgi:branched-chain amino acid transport system substrate-binding protein